jgi:hypothetical protein
MTPASLYEVIAELAGLLAETTLKARTIARNQAFELTAQSFEDIAAKALHIQHLLEGEAELFEASEMVDPFEAA